MTREPKLTALDAPARHKVRIHAKRLLYMLEFFEPLASHRLRLAGECVDAERDVGDLVSGSAVRHRRLEAPLGEAALRLLDLTPCAKLLLRGVAKLALSEFLPAFGHSRRPVDCLYSARAVASNWSPL